MLETVRLTEIMAVAMEVVVLVTDAETAVALAGAVALRKAVIQTVAWAAAVGWWS